MARSFSGDLLPVPHGGHYVVVPPKVAAAAGLRYGMRVRGEVNGVAYRSSLMMYGGIFHLGVHKATIAAAGITAPARVKVTIEEAAEPLPTDTVPPDLARELASNARAVAAWKVLRPSAKREHVKALLEAKKAETRERRLAKIMKFLAAG